MANANDRFGYNEAGIQKAIDNLDEVHQSLNKIKTSFIEYVDGPLNRKWNSTGGVTARNKLHEFVDNDVVRFINDVNNQIDNMVSVKSDVRVIDNA